MTSLLFLMLHSLTPLVLLKALQSIFSEEVHYKLC